MRYSITVRARDKDHAKAKAESDIARLAEIQDIALPARRAIIGNVGAIVDCLEDDPSRDVLVTFGGFASDLTTLSVGATASLVPRLKRDLYLETI